MTIDVGFLPVLSIVMKSGHGWRFRGVVEAGQAVVEEIMSNCRCVEREVGGTFFPNGTLLLAARVFCNPVQCSAVSSVQQMQRPRLGNAPKMGPVPLSQPRRARPSRGPLPLTL